MFNYFEAGFFFHVCVCARVICVVVKAARKPSIFSAYDNGSNLSYGNNRGVRGGAAPLNTQRRSGERERRATASPAAISGDASPHTLVSPTSTQSPEALTRMLGSEQAAFVFSEELVVVVPNQVNTVV